MIQVSLDTSFLISFADPDRPNHPVAVDYFRHCLARRIPMWISVVAAGEFEVGEPVDDPEIATRVSQYEMAFRRQASVPALMDVSQEPAKVLELYGTRGADGSFAANCLLARSLAERGVRFIQLCHRDFRYQGREFRLTDVSGEVVRAVLA